MPLLRDEDRKEIGGLLAKSLVNPVTIHLYTQHESPLALPAQECHTCRETGELLDEIAELSDKLEVVRHDVVAEADDVRAAGVTQIPTLVFEGQVKGRMRYVGVPAGYEFSVLLGALIDASRGATELSAATRKALAQLPGPVHLEVLVTPT